jgi:lysozyme
MRKFLITSILSLFSIRLGSSSPNEAGMIIPPIQDKPILVDGQKNIAELRFKQEDDRFEAALLKTKSLITWDSVFNMVKRRESLQLKPYTCPGGYLSVGYGHVITKTEEYLKAGITEEQADSLLHNDMEYYKSWVQKKLKLKGNKLKAITHFCYAFGTTKLQKSELYKRIQSGEAIEDEIIKWVNIKGKPNPSLLRQRKLELAWYNNKQAN